MLKNPTAAAEDYIVEDLLDFGDKVESLHSKVENTPRRAMIGVVGKYGTGKSVLLNTYRDKYVTEDSGNLWIHFDAWKYPDRKDLWEGFVLDFVHQYKPEYFHEFQQLIDGQIGKVKKTAAALAKTIPLVGSAASDSVKAFTERSPAKRVYEIQGLFAELLRSDRPNCIYVVVEDADRSGEAGIFFIETLSHFMKMQNIPDVKIKIFVPISTDSFLDDVAHEAYIKALDVVSYYKIDERDLVKFTKAIFNESYIEIEQYQDKIVEWTRRLLYSYGFSLRQIKFIIRESEMMFKELYHKGFHPDPVIVYLMASAKTIMSAEQLSLHDTFKSKSYIKTSEQIALIVKAHAHNTTVAMMVELVNEHPNPAAVFANNVEIASANEGVMQGREYSIRQDTGTVVASNIGTRFCIPSFYLRV